MALPDVGMQVAAFFETSRAFQGNFANAPVVLEAVFVVQSKVDVFAAELAGDRPVFDVAV